MFLFVCLCIKVYVLCMFVYFRTYHSMQIFIKLGMADKIADFDNSINAISTKVNARCKILFRFCLADPANQYRY